MLQWLISTSSSKLLIGLAALTLPMVSDSSGRHAPVDVRPDVAVVVGMTGPDFELALGRASRDTLLRLIRESLPQVLERNVGFLDWGGEAGVATDTLEVNWVQRADDPHDAMLHLTFKGVRIKSAAATGPMPFERWEDLLSRVWTPRDVSRDWSVIADTLLKRERGDLVESLFGQMPLDLTPITRRVRPHNRDLRVSVELRPDEIRAAEAPTPEFLLQVRVRDPLPPGSVGDGSLKLRGCNRTEDQKGYVCRMGRFIYQDDTTTAEERRDVLARVELVPLSLHLLRYTPSSIQIGPGGTVAP